MANCQMIEHEIKRGDTLYGIAKLHHTTVPLLLLANPGVNPYNLQIGSMIKVCVGNEFVEKPSLDEMQLLEDMLQTMLAYTGWMKLYLSLQGEKLQNERRMEAADRTENTVSQLIDIFKVFYPASVTRQMNTLLAEGYTKNLFSYADALHEDDMEAANKLGKNIDENGKQLAVLLAKQNTSYSEEKLLETLEALKENVYSIVTDAQNNNITGEFDGYERLDEAAAELAAYLADGLIRAFYKENR